MKTFFKEILEYTFVFNDRVIDALILNSNPPEKSIKLINHTINSHEIWNSRIERKSVSIDVWGTRQLEALKGINLLNYNKSLAIIEESDFETIITYTNTRGETFENSIRDIFFHMVNHSTYHRGQIATDFKMNGIAPLVTDFIVYKRTKI